MRDFFTKDLSWKLFSLFLAMAVWFTANRILHESVVLAPDANIRTVTYDNLPVTVVSATSDVRAFLAVPTAVKVVVSGPVAAMNSLRASELHAIVNVTGANLERGALLPVEISSPANVAVTIIEPDRVLITPPVPTESKP